MSEAIFISSSSAVRKSELHDIYNFKAKQLGFRNLSDLRNRSPKNLGEDARKLLSMYELEWILSTEATIQALDMAS